MVRELTKRLVEIKKERDFLCEQADMRLKSDTKILADELNLEKTIREEFMLEKENIKDLEESNFAAHELERVIREKYQEM